NTSLAIYAANNLIGLLDQWSLIFSNRYNRRFETGDVGGLGDGIAEKACRNISAKTSRLDFVLNGRVALKPRHRDKVHVQQGQIGECRKMRLKTYRGQVRVDPNSQVVCRDLKDIVAHPTRVVRVIRECLGIRQQQVLPVRRL